MSVRHVVKAFAACSAATLCGVAFVLVVGAGPAGANTLTSGDGNTTLTTIGTVTSGTPYSSGQSITVTVAPNSVMNNANLVANNAPGQTTGNTTGSFYLEECIDPGGLTANLPTTTSDCERGRQHSQSLTSNGSLTDTFIVYDLPDPGTLGLPTMTGTCDAAPNQCVIGIFAASPQSGNGFKYPHLFSAPFQMDKQADFGSGAGRTGPW